jgi:hypothetical protein
MNSKMIKTPIILRIYKYSKVIYKLGTIDAKIKSRTLCCSFGKLEIISCIFWQENNFVNALIQFIWVRRMI